MADAGEARLAADVGGKPVVDGIDRRVVSVGRERLIG